MQHNSKTYDKINHNHQLHNICEYVAQQPMDYAAACKFKNGNWLLIATNFIGFKNVPILHYHNTNETKDSTQHNTNTNIYQQTNNIKISSEYTM